MTSILILLLLGNLKLLTYNINSIRHAASSVMGYNQHYIDWCQARRPEVKFQFISNVLSKVEIRTCTVDLISTLPTLSKPCLGAQIEYHARTCLCLFVPVKGNSRHNTARMPFYAVALRFHITGTKEPSKSDGMFK